MQCLPIREKEEHASVDFVGKLREIELEDDMNDNVKNSSLTSDEKENSSHVTKCDQEIAYFVDNNQNSPDLFSEETNPEPLDELVDSGDEENREVCIVNSPEVEVYRRTLRKTQSGHQRLSKFTKFVKVDTKVKTTVQQSKTTLSSSLISCQDSTADNSLNTTSHKRKLPFANADAYLYAPKTTHPKQYIGVIVSYFDNYFAALREAQDKLPYNSVLPYGIPVLTNRISMKPIQTISTENSEGIDIEEEMTNDNTVPDKNITKGNQKATRSKGISFYENSEDDFEDYAKDNDYIPVKKRKLDSNSAAVSRKPVVIKDIKRDDKADHSLAVTEKKNSKEKIAVTLFDKLLNGDTAIKDRYFPSCEKPMRETRNSRAKKEETTALVACPICNKMFSETEIEVHASGCCFSEEQTKVDESQQNKSVVRQNEKRKPVCKKCQQIVCLNDVYDHEKHCPATKISRTFYGNK